MLFHTPLLSPPLILPSAAPSHTPFCLHSWYHGDSLSSLLTTAQILASPGLVPTPPAVLVHLSEQNTCQRARVLALGPAQHGACGSTCQPAKVKRIRSSEVYKQARLRIIKVPSAMPLNINTNGVNISGYYDHIPKHPLIV